MGIKTINDFDNIYIGILRRQADVYAYERGHKEIFQKATFHNFKTGDVCRGSALPEDAIALLTSRRYVCASVYRTTEDGKLGIYSGFMDLSSPSRGPKIRTWDIRWKTVYVDKNKNTTTDGEVGSQVFALETVDSNNLEKCFREVFGTSIVLLGGNNFSCIKDGYSLTAFMKHKEPAKKNGKSQQLIDQLCVLTPEVEELPAWHSYERAGYHPQGTRNGFCMLSKIEGYEKPCVVLRTFAIDTANKLIEGNRLYIMKGKTVAAKKTMSGYVTATTQYASYWQFPLIKFEKDICKDTPLEYYATILDDFDEKDHTLLLYMIIKYPFIESLVKAGYRDILNYMIYNLCCYSSSCAEVVKNLFGTINEKEKGLYKILGTNKSQLQSLQRNLAFALKNNVLIHLDSKSPTETMASLSSPETLTNMFDNIITSVTIGSVKDILDVSSIADYDDNTISLITNLIAICGRGRLSYDAVKVFIQLYGVKALKSKFKMFVDIKYSADVKNAFTCNASDFYSRWRNSAEILLVDYLDMVATVKDTVNFRCDFHNYDELKAAHDAILLLAETVKNESKLEDFQKNEKKLNKYVYSDDKFSVIVPQRPEELAKEGLTLHHCVKTYIDKVCSGRTGIMFIRENDNIEEPFFTVEVQRGVVCQVHGVNNCNVNVNPDVAAFVNKWIDNKKLSTNERGYNIVR